MLPRISRPLWRERFTSSYGGIKIDMQQGAGYFDAAHFLFDEMGGFSALMKMFDHNPQETVKERTLPGAKEWAVRTPMLALSNPDHQSLSSQYGLKKLVEHIWKVVGIASTCSDIDELKKKMEELYGKKPGFQFELKLVPQKQLTSAQ